MKLTLRYALLASLIFSGAAPAGAEGFVDVFAGAATFAPVDVTESRVQIAYPVEHNQSANNISIANSPAGGLRIGGIHKWDHFSLGGAFVMDFYSVKANFQYPTSSEIASIPSKSFYATPQQGGTIWQPGGDFIVGIPLRFIRLYGGVGLSVPIMFYKYTSYDANANTYSPDAMGSSAALAYNSFLGARWLISNNFNIFLEDRFTDLFTPLVIKNSYYSDPSHGNLGIEDSSFTLKSLHSNRVVFGVGFAWGS